MLPRLACGPRDASVSPESHPPEFLPSDESTIPTSAPISSEELQVLCIPNSTALDDERLSVLPASGTEFRNRNGQAVSVVNRLATLKAVDKERRRNKFVARSPYVALHKDYQLENNSAYNSSNPRVPRALHSDRIPRRIFLRLPETSFRLNNNAGSHYKRQPVSKHRPH